jgi:hypothetical protein
VIGFVVCFALGLHGTTSVSEFRFQGLPSVGLSQFFCLSGMEENCSLSGGGGNFLLSSSRG